MSTPDIPDLTANRSCAIDDADDDARLRFQTLIARLGTQRTPGGTAYEQLRRRLILLLHMHVPAEAETLADVALDRLARRIHDGALIDSPHLFALGIARKLVLEAQNRAAKQQRMAEDPTMPNAPIDGEAEELESMHSALSACLEQLGTNARGLILAYYGADGAERVRMRQHLANELGLSVNALRNRALRLREQLAHCVRLRLHASRENA